jgi:hypothetical protein
MKRKAKMIQEEIEEDEEDSDEEDSDDDDGDDDSHLTNTCENLKVFCVSSSEYQKLKNKLTEDGPPMVRKRKEKKKYHIIIVNTLFSLMDLNVPREILSILILLDYFHFHTSIFLCQPFSVY